MLTLRKGRYAARMAETDADREAAQRLRALAFRVDDELDSDPFDADCTHVLVEDQRSGALVCCFRLLHLGSGGYWLWGAPAGKQEGESDKKSQSFDHWIHHSPIMG